MSQKRKYKAGTVMLPNSGYEVRTVPISPMLFAEADKVIVARWEEQGKKRPTPPTYTTTTAGGDTETLEHDVTTLTTDEDKADWEAYVNAAYLFTMQVGELLMDIAFMEGVEVEVEESWVRRRKLLGLSVPDDEDARRLLYIKTELCKGDDGGLLFQAICELSGVKAGSAQVAKDSFRRSLEG